MDSLIRHVLVSISEVRNLSTMHDDTNDTTMVKERMERSLFIGQQVFDTLNLVLGRISLPLIQVFGITTNLINLRIFWSLDIRNVVTSCFFSLSLADLCYLLVAHTITICLLLDSFVSGWVRLDGVAFSMLGYARWTLAISTLFTTYMAIQRCCYVALPFKVKNIFTPTKNAAIMVWLFLLTFPIYLPSQSARGIRILWDPLTNASYVGLWNAERYEAALEILDYTAFLSFPIIVQIVTMACMLILIRGLRESSEFRKTSAVRWKESGVDDAMDKVKSKDVQVVKAVTFVTLMFIISNVPSIAVGILRRVLPNFRAHGENRNLFLTVNVLRDIVQNLNSSLNILVYYHFNCAYREKLRVLFGSNL